MSEMPKDARLAATWQDGWGPNGASDINTPEMPGFY